MARTSLLLVAVLAAGCKGADIQLQPGTTVLAISWGGPDVHRPDIQTELDSVYEHPPCFKSSWEPSPTVFEKGLLGSVSNGRSRRDDSPSWLGPSHLGGSVGADSISADEVAIRVAEHDEHVKKNDRELGEDGTKIVHPPRPADLDRALGTWEDWKAERGIAPVDLGPAPKPEKKGP